MQGFARRHEDRRLDDRLGHDEGAIGFVALMAQNTLVEDRRIEPERAVQPAGKGIDE